MRRTLVFTILGLIGLVCILSFDRPLTPETRNRVEHEQLDYVRGIDVESSVAN